MSGRVREELGALLRLAWPVVLAQIGLMTFGLVDVWMVGRLGATELAAVALADVCVFGSLVFGIGLVMGVDPIITQAHGAGEHERTGLALQRGIVLALLVSLPIALVWWNTDAVLRWAGEPRALAGIAGLYARTQVFSVAPFLIFIALRQYLLGRGLVRPPLWIILIANVANVGLNEVFIFGRLGFPVLGVRGAALATGSTRTLLLFGMLALMRLRRLHAGAWRAWGRDSFRLAGLGHVLRYGLPLSAQYCLEVWAFSASNLFAGWLGATAAAAHLVVLKLASLAFMTPWGISVAAATRVGNLLGAGERERAQRAALVAIGVGGAVMLVSATAFLAIPEALVRLFSTDAAVIALGATIFPVAAAFQLFDGTQCVAGGILRGMGTTRPAAVINLLGFYVLALPLAYTLAFSRGLGLPGIWWGLCAGLGAVAFGLVGWVAWRGPARLKRLAIAPAGE